MVGRKLISEMTWWSCLMTLYLWVTLWWTFQEQNSETISFFTFPIPHLEYQTEQSQTVLIVLKSDSAKCPAGYLGNWDSSARIWTVQCFTVSLYWDVVWCVVCGGFTQNINNNCSNASIHLILPGNFQQTNLTSLQEMKININIDCWWQVISNIILWNRNRKYLFHHLPLSLSHCTDQVEDPLYGGDSQHGTTVITYNVKHSQNWTRPCQKEFK